MTSPARRTLLLLVTPLLVATTPLLVSGPTAARVIPGSGGGTVPRSAVAFEGTQQSGDRGAAPASGGPAAPVAGSAVSGPGAAARLGGWPLRPEPEVVNRFAPPPVAWAAGHRGVDLRGRPGQQVRAARAGAVTFAGRIAGRGVVVVSHGDTRTTYEPVTASVARGDLVAQGAVLGRLELLGSHCLPRACLHWGLIRGETYLDPLTLVGRGPVRLLPWTGLPAG
jgi:murein DD-endopeptidase MepM/ murein hydrolase activator NlpD